MKRLISFLFLKSLFSYLFILIAFTSIKAQDTLQIQYGNSITANIAQTGEIDAYTFTGEAGDVVIVRMRFSAGANGSRIELYDPSGKLVGSDAVAYNNFARIDTVKLEESGIYTILAMEIDGDQTGEYGISLQRSFEPLNSQPISYNESLNASIDQLAEMDAYTFTGEAGDVVIVRMRFSAGANGSRIELYDPSGKLLSSKSASNSSVTLDNIELDEIGIYTILAMELNGNQTGSYDLSLNAIPTLPRPIEAPTNLQAEFSDTKVVLTWTENLQRSLLRYRIYRDTESPSTTFLRSIEKGMGIYIDSINIDPNNIYFYRITSVDTSLNESSFSNEANTFLQKFADLEVSLVETAQEIFSGQLLNLNWQISNRGEEGTQIPEWFDRIYLSSSAQFDPSNSTVLGTFENFSYLSTNEAYQNTAQFNLPKDLFGTFYIHVVTDVKNQLQETNEENNSGSSNSIKINLSPFPDLEVTSVTAQDNALSGDLVEITWTVSNTGNARTEKEEWFDRIYISKNDTFEVIPSVISGLWLINETPLDHLHHEGSLGPDSSYTASLTIEVPHQLYGNYYLFIHTDALENCSVPSHPNECFTINNNDIYEFNQEFDNWASEPINIVLSDLPDLVVTDIKTPLNANLGQEIEIEWSVQNKGLSDTYESSWRDQIYISSSPTFNIEQSKILGTYPRLGILERDGIYTNKVSVKIPSGFIDPSYIFIKADYNNQVFENDFEDNNIARDETAIGIYNPDFTITEMVAPNNVYSGKTIDLNWKVLNQGNGSLFNGSWSDRIFISKNSNYSEDSVTELDIFATTGNVLKDSLYFMQKSILLPNGIEGPHYIFIKTDVNNQIFEADFEENNIKRIDTPIQVNLSPWADLNVTSSNFPAIVNAGQRVSITWNVENKGKAIISEASWNDQIFISQNEIFNLDDSQLLKIAERSKPLNPSSIYTQSTSVTLSSALVGIYYIYIVTDADNVVYEHTDEANNIFRTDAITVQPYPPIDLSVLNISVPDSGSSGLPISIQWSVENKGSGKTLVQTWDDALYISNDTLLNENEDILLGQISHSGALKPGDSYSRKESINLPELTGDYFAIVKTDFANDVGDINIENNHVVSKNKVSISVTASADLEITSVEAPSMVIAGQPITVQFRNENKGEGNTKVSRWYEGFFLSSDPKLDNSDIRISTYTRNGELLPGEFYIDSLELDIPTYASGSYFLLTNTDNRDDIYERGGENNNTRALSISATIPPPADLIVTSVVVPDSAAPGEDVSVTWTLENIGENSAVGQMRDAVYISDDSTWHVDDPLLGVVSRFINIAPGNTEIFSKQFNLAKIYAADAEGNIIEELPGVIPGEYNAIVRTDIRNNISESNSTNNNSSSETKLNTTLPILELDKILNGTLSEGQTLYFQINIDADKDLKINFNSSVNTSSNEIYIANGRIPTVSNYDYAENEPFSPNHEIIIPTTQVGKYYLMIYARNIPSETEDFSLIAEALSFSITSITPDYGGSGGTVTSIIKGSGFRETSKIFLQHSSNQETEGEIVQYINTTELKVKWDLRGISEGSYDVSAENNGNIIKLANRFMVEDVINEDINLEIVSPDIVRFGSLANYSINIKNNGNVDIEYMLVYILIPSSVEPKLINNTPGLLKRSDLYPEQIKNEIKDFSYGYGSFDDITSTEFNIIEFVARDISPNQLLTSNIAFKGAVPPDLPVKLGVETFKTNSFITLIQERIESFRMSILNDPEIENQEIINLALNQTAFRDSVLEYNYIKNGLITHEEIGSISVNKYGRTNVKNSTTLLANNNLPNINCDDDVGRACHHYAAGICLMVGGGTGIIGGLICAAIWFEMCLQHVKNVCHPVGVPFDPNEIIGPTGFGDKNWITKNITLPYTIRFENDSTQATASAQIVQIKQQLSGTLDARSFRIGSFGIGEIIFNVPNNSAFYTHRLDLQDSLGLFVDFSAGLDIITNEIFWNFKSIDPATGELPTFRGFLPVNDSFGKGQGFVNYTIDPDENAQTGDIINAQAEIIFDINEPILTPKIFNTIDADIPNSKIQELPEIIDSNTFQIFWSGIDDSTGSGIKNYDIYYSENDEPFQELETNIQGTSLTFSGDFGSAYGFITYVKDNAGNVEDLKTKPDAVVILDSVTAISDEDNLLPTKYTLHQNYPNPFNPSTTIKYELPKYSKVKIDIYNILGQRVITLINSKQEPGFYELFWNGKNNFGSNIASGIYFYRIVANNFIKTKKMVFLK
jgi:ribosomal protein S28E/S33